MNRFCPNLSNPQVKQEFTELVQAVGEDAAYFLWDKNNGYHLDKAPNGADSKLFNDLVKYYEGDRTKALQIKSRVYSDAFKEWFGDWQSEDKTNVSKVVDKMENRRSCGMVRNGNLTHLNWIQKTSVVDIKYTQTWLSDGLQIEGTRLQNIMVG